MNNDATYQKLVDKMKEVSALSPQGLGPLTPLYRAVIPYFKKSPWKPLTLGSLILALCMYVLFGASLVYLVSVLQHGF